MKAWLFQCILAARQQILIAYDHAKLKLVAVTILKMKKWSSQWTQCMQLRKEAWGSGLQRGLNPWPRDTEAMLYQLSYEATDVGSRSIVGSYVPVEEMSVNDIWNIYICHDFVAKSAAIL